MILDHDAGDYRYRHAGADSQVDALSAWEAGSWPRELGDRAAVGSVPARVGGTVTETWATGKMTIDREKAAVPARDGIDGGHGETARDVPTS
ncbi:hypothetical protein Afe04nite_78210 [Asanoa ferruginea]|nr:hypothetical protein Afe04nite_78210 [Asanoa ferruginea]